MPPRFPPAHLQRLASRSNLSPRPASHGVLTRAISRPVSRLRPLVPRFPTTTTCPPPSCGCAPTPPLPPGTEIDRTSPLNGAIATYAEQVLVCTGRADWPSRIEDEHGGDNLAGALKQLFGRGGPYADPWHNVSILNASFPSAPAEEVGGVAFASAYLLPSFKYIPRLHRRPEALEALARGYVLPTTLHAAHGAGDAAYRERLTRDEAYREVLPGEDVRDVLVLVCGHGGRDVRCGTMGPVLRDEFEAVLGRAGFRVAEGPDGTRSRRGTARVGLVSHVGGHKFAGNVIIYIPPGRDGHGLAGCGIWYGRVEPKHVEGLVEETVVKGRVVAEHFRGGIDAQRKMLRL